MNSGSLILVVDDEPKIVQIVRAYLEKGGFQVVAAYDGAAAMEAFHRMKPNLIVLDLMLPSIDGIELTKRIRSVSEVPIIMLTARAEEVDRLVGLEIGADDYVVKPFSPRELIARVRAVLRRSQGPAAVSATAQDREAISSGGIVIHQEQRRVEVDGAPVQLTAVQFDLLSLFVVNPGTVFTREKLLQETTGDSYNAYERTIDAHIKNLRKALGEDSRAPRFIHTVHGVGYRYYDSNE